MQRLAVSGSGSVAGLPNYCTQWSLAAQNILFRNAQDAVVDQLYFAAVEDAADTLGLSFALTQAFIFDTAVQHGDGSDPDGLQSLIQKTNNQKGIPQSEDDEKNWLRALIDIRK